jgi:hypothetical protein
MRRAKLNVTGSTLWRTDLRRRTGDPYNLQVILRRIGVVG